MGQEAKCIARYKGQSGPGTALLESDGIHYRGAFRLFIPAADLKSAKVENGLLETTVADEVARLELGSVANDWLHRILNPKSLLDKLGIKSGLEISLVGEFDAAFETQLSSVAGKVTRGKLRPQSDMVFFAAENKADLNALAKISAALKPRSALWIIYPKGVETIRESDVSAAAKASGLVANKVVSFSPSHTGLRFVSTGRN
jgi:hypothetical protein